MLFMFGKWQAVRTSVYFAYVFFCVDEFVYILKMSTVFATLPGLR